MTGNTWTSVRYFSTFEEADTLRTSLKTTDTSGTLQVKVKRCGEGGTQFVVKTRQSAELVQAQASLEESEESTKKTSKRVRKTKT